MTIICDLSEILTTRSPKQPLQLAEFDKQVALEALCKGQGDRIHRLMMISYKSLRCDRLVCVANGEAK